MLHPYKKSFLKKQQRFVHSEERIRMKCAARFTLSISANTAVLNLTDYKIDRVYIHQLKNAIHAAVNKGVNVVKFDLSKLLDEAVGSDFLIVSTLLALGRNVKIDVLRSSD